MGKQFILKNETIWFYWSLKTECKEEVMELKPLPLSQHYRKYLGKHQIDNELIFFKKQNQLQQLTFSCLLPICILLNLPSIWQMKL